MHFQSIHKLPTAFEPPIIDVEPVQTAIIQTGGGAIAIQHDLPLPVPEPHQVLVKTVAVSINPCDWKMPSKFPAVGAIVGCDFAGTVLAIGPEAASVRPDLKVGDRVCGGVHGNNPIDLASGAFAQYVAAHSDLLLKLPKTMSWEAGAVLGGSVTATLQLALYNSLGLNYTPNKPFTASDGSKPPHVLVYGGSTSTGAMALQILSLSGYHPITTCSPHNFGLVKSFGATAAFDYHSPTCAADIKSYTSGKLSLVLDIITDARSQQTCHAALGRLGGRYTCLELPSDAFHTRKTTVKMDMVVGLAASGKEIALAEGYERSADPGLRSDAAGLFRCLQGLVDRGDFKTHPARVLNGGWKGLLQGLEILRARETSGEKLVGFLDGSR